MDRWIRGAAIALALLAVPGAVAAAPVVVFPLQAREMPAASAHAATRAVLEALHGVAGLQVLDPSAVQARLGINLTEQALECRYDVFCIVEIGEILEAAKVLVGHVLRQPGDGQPPYELKLVVLDVDRAAMAEVLRWRVNDLAAVSTAARVAGRRLLVPPDAQVAVALDPPTASLSLYGEPQSLPRRGRWSTWSGAYQLRVEAEGYLTVERPWTVSPGHSALEVTLEPDPLYVRARTPASASGPFERSSRRPGRGVTAQDVDVGTRRSEPRSRFSRPWPWATVGVGLAATVTGAVLMATAQADYNALANEVRFSATDTTAAFAAARDREDLNARHQLGTGIAAAGAVVLTGGLLWLLIGGDEPSSSAASGRPEAQGQRPAPATVSQRAAARAIVASFARRRARAVTP